MSIVATLTEAENRHTATAHAFASIPLNKLVPWDGNVRKTNSTEGLAELTANIEAHGVLQSLVVTKTNRGRYKIIAGRRRFLALSSLADAGTIAPDAPVPCRIIAGSADATEIGLAENIVRAPMHPADQFDAFRTLIDDGASIADVAARFGISETAVKQRLKLARVSPVVFEAYRKGDLDLEQVQAFAVSDDHAAQERIFGELPDWDNDPGAIRSALTQDEIGATDKRVKFVTVEGYEAAGGTARRDLFAEGDEGVFILDAALLDRLVREKLEAAADSVRAEGWKWVEIQPEADYAALGRFQRRHPEPLPLSEEAAAEHKRLAEEYQTLFENGDEEDEARSERLDEIETRIAELEDTERAFTPDATAIAGAVVTVGYNGQLDVTRGLVRPEDVPDGQSASSESGSKEKPLFSASLVESLTASRSLATSALLLSHPKVALASVVHALAVGLFRIAGEASSLQLSAKFPRLRESCKGKEALDEAHDNWLERIPTQPGQLWNWCLEQTQDTLLELLAFCAAHALDGVQRKGDRPDGGRLSHAQALTAAVNLDMAQWFTPTADNYFRRIGRPEIISAITEAKQVPAKRSWDKLKKAEFASFAEREIAGTGWLPQPLRT
jgi:ParB family chromosome partitioning protein